MVLVKVSLEGKTNIYFKETGKAKASVNVKQLKMTIWVRPFSFDYLFLYYLPYAGLHAKK